MSNNLFLFSFSVIENWSMNSGKAYGILKTEIEDDSSDINYIRSKFAWPFCYQSNMFKF